MARELPGKGSVTLYFDREVYRQLAHRAVDEDKSLPDLLRGWILERVGSPAPVVELAPAPVELVQEERPVSAPKVASITARVCVECGKEFTPHNAGSAATARFCGDRCRSKAHKRLARSKKKARAASA
jgi:hypothetical protein